MPQLSAHRLTLVAVLAGALLGLAATVGFVAVTIATNDRDGDGVMRATGEWAAGEVWHDGLVEKAVYEAEKVIYGRPRRYEAIFLTNREQHDIPTLTKAVDDAGGRVEVWKFNKIEAIPTPNYDYHFVTTSHLTAARLELTRLDATSQEWCGTSFRQYRAGRVLPGGRVEGSYEFTGFSYMPEAGFVSKTIAPGDRPVVPFNALPLWLRGYDFDSRPEVEVDLILDQRSNGPVPPQPVRAVVRYEEPTSAGHRLAVALHDGQPVGAFEMASDRNHLMLSYEGADGQKYRLSRVERVDYWTREE